MSKTREALTGNMANIGTVEYSKPSRSPGLRYSENVILENTRVSFSGLEVTEESRKCWRVSSARLDDP